MNDKTNLLISFHLNNKHLEKRRIVQVTSIELNKAMYMDWKIILAAVHVHVCSFFLKRITIARSV